MAADVKPDLAAVGYQAIYGDGWRHCDRDDRIVEKVLAAVLSTHERMIREQVAKAIEAERDDVASNEGATIADERAITSRCNGLAHAARIARGGV